MPLSDVTIYTDGACKGNPGPGGYGAVLLSGSHRKELHGGFRKTTNNRMEMMALIVALEALKRPCKLTIVTDSTYLMNAFAKGWIRNWKRNGWQTKAKNPVQNKDLWVRLDGLLDAHEVDFRWTKGHASNAENNRCDTLASNAATKRNLPADAAYEATT